jgi:peptidyl-prolyl cis-trans isomerase C
MDKIDAPPTLRYGSRPMRSTPFVPLTVPFFVPFFVAVCALTACQQPGKDTTSAEQPAAAQKSGEPAAADTGTAAVAEGAVVATYGNETLTDVEIVAEMSRLPGPSRAYLTQDDRKKQFVENMILNELLFDEGQRRGLADDPEIEQQVRDMRKRLVVQRLMREYQTPPEVTDEQVQVYYDANPHLFSTSKIQASHILVKDEAEAKAIREQLLKDPSKFAEIAKEKSTDKTSGAKGGDLGKFGQGRMVPEFERAAFALQPNTLSDPVKTQYGWHIILVTEREEGERRPFDQVKEQIRSTLRNQQMREAMDKHFAELKSKANLSIDEQALAKVTPPAPAAGGNPHMGH